VVVGGGCLGRGSGFEGHRATLATVRIRLYLPGSGPLLEHKDRTGVPDTVQMGHVLPSLRVNPGVRGSGRPRVDRASVGVMR